MVTTDQLRSAFGTNRIRIVPRERIPHEIHSRSAQKALAEIGLPPALMDIVMVHSEITSSIPKLSKVYARYGESAPPHLAQLFKIAQFGAGSACLDGGSGQVLLVILDRPNLDPPLINSTLEFFIEFLHEIELGRAAAAGDDSPLPHIRRLTDRLAALDPPAMGELSPWHFVIEAALDESNW
ncbi:SUKH-4 family immunity protein [Streptomyces sp. I05A-00742]|uniref:SUKH-4 family immunity protein n=1 Tax=Streptomyces sp. I05A-00742 TaxID=2732853 RepID=UPI00148877CC|nr:SUKH-4 family immunity protein [Streptomyces sp. I05A-00742]